MPDSFPRLVRWSGGLVLAALLLLAGCQSNDADESTETDDSPPMVAPTERSLDQQVSPRTLARRYLRYAHQGALLSSDHPLSDSLAVLMAGAVGGRTLTVIDTFRVASVQTTGDSVHTVRARFPRSVQIQSVTWETSGATVDATRSIRIQKNHVREAPHIVGWPAFQRHLRDVAPAAADSVLPRMRPQFGESPSEAGV